VTPSQVVYLYQKRWAVELMHREPRSGLGLGEYQVSGDKDRSEKSVGIGCLALAAMPAARHPAPFLAVPCGTGLLPPAAGVLARLGVGSR
jgi:hypothetical protein